MHELLREGADPDTSTSAVRVVRAAEVAALRRSSPDSAIVALVRSTEPREAIAAQLAGADVVLPCTGDAGPDQADLAAARVAARLLAERARVIREQTRAAAHEFAGHASAVALVAALLGPDEPAQRAVQLRGLASRGAELAWRAGRVARSSGTSVEILDLAASIRSICHVLRTPGQLDLRIHADAGVLALVDSVRLACALAQLIDNSRRAGARVVTVQVADEQGPADEGPGQQEPGPATHAPWSGWATLTVVDDGRGLRDGLTPEDALTPFVSGWSEPGDGLGLAEVAEFAADHGGRLTVEPRQDADGVRAVLRFPAVSEPVDAGLAPPGISGVARGDAADPDWALASILEGIAGREPVGESLEALVATMERYLPDSTCSILLLDQESGTLCHGAGARLPAPYRAAIDGLRIGPLAGSCGTAAFTREEVVVADIATDERWADYRHHALPFGLRSCWSRPILAVDRRVVLGTFAVYHSEQWVPGPAATELVQRLTHVAAVAIGTAALHGQLVESEARFRSTFEAAGLGIALVGPSGTIQDANAALVAMAGRSVVGESFAGLLVDDDAAATRDALRSLLAATGDEKHLTNAEVRVRRPDRTDSEPIWVAMSGSLIRGPAGEPRHFCIELFDLTERRRVAQARRERAVAQAADRAKSELLALVSHDVRTPLHAVIGFAQVLRSMQLPPERQLAAIDHILGAGRHLLQLMNDLLDLTGAETGQLQLVLEPVQAREVVAEAMEIVAGLADERSITLRSRPAAGALAVRADRHRLRQVLLNLLGNAIKFTPVGGAVDVVMGPGKILVVDNGDGIPPDQLPFLFTPFHRGAAGSTSGVEGSGLGLALSQRLMRAMEGDLTLVTSSNKGTTFRLTLPTASPAAISRELRSPASMR
jgi:PAS domain S-box-containing protein